MKFASQYVRLVKCELDGMEATEIKDNYLIKVSEPYSHGTSGELIRKGGLFPSEGAVPDGKTLKEIKEGLLLSRDRPTEAVMAAARAKYGRAYAPISGAPIDVFNKEQFPKAGDKWI